MRYEEAIEWLAAHDVRNKDDKPHVFGMDIEEGTTSNISEAKLR